MILAADFDRSVLRRRFVVKFAKLSANHRIKCIKKNLKSEFTRWMMMNAKLRLRSRAPPCAPCTLRACVFDSRSIYGFPRIILVGHVGQTALLHPNSNSNCWRPNAVLRVLMYRSDDKGSVRIRIFSCFNVSGNRWRIHMFLRTFLEIGKARRAL
jgi:hypothetical protein